MIVNKQLVKNY